MAFDFVQTYLTTLRGIDFAHLNTIFAEMETRGRGLLRQAGVPEEAITVIAFGRHALPASGI